MADFQEEIYLIEKKEISDDEFGDEELEQLNAEVENIDLGSEDDDDNDLNDFNALKAKTEQKAVKTKDESAHSMTVTGVIKTTETPVVIDDFIRNFLTHFSMNKTMNTFQQEWFELQKKGVF